MPSRLKRAHRTHALDQRAGEPYPRPVAGGGTRRDGDERVLRLYAQLCERVPDSSKRAELLGASAELEAAWRRGAALPALRARRRALERAVGSR